MIVIGTARVVFAPVSQTQEAEILGLEKASGNIPWEMGRAKDMGLKLAQWFLTTFPPVWSLSAAPRTTWAEHFQSTCRAPGSISRKPHGCQSSLGKTVLSSKTEVSESVEQPGPETRLLPRMPQMGL